MISERLLELGIELPPPFPPAGNYLACVIDEGLVHVGGHGPIAGDEIVRGKVGADLTLEQAQEAARMTGLSILATLRAELGDLDRIERLVKVFGMVNCAPGFNQTPAVINGCSDLRIVASVRGCADRKLRRTFAFVRRRLRARRIRGPARICFTVTIPRKRLGGAVPSCDAVEADRSKR